MKKTAVLLLLGAMLTAQLASCGETAEDPSETGDAPTTEAVTEAQTEPSEYTVPSVDYEGQTFTIACMDTDMTWALAQYLEIMHEENGDIIQDSIVKAVRQTEEELGVKFETLGLATSERNDISRLTKFITAGDDAFQLGIVLTCALPNVLTTSGMLMDLNDLPTLDLTHSWWDQRSVEAYNLFDKQYTAVGDICLWNLGAPICYFFNKGIVNSLDLDNPYQYVYDGTWTLDTMIAMAHEAVYDIDGDGTMDPLKDRYGFIGEASSLSYGLVGAGVNVSKRDSNDNVTITVNNERTPVVVEKIVTLLNDRTLSLFDHDYYSKYNSVFTELFLPTFLDNRALFFSNQLLVALDLRSMKADFGILPMPKYDENQKDYIGDCNTYWRDNVIVPATCPDPALAGYVMDSLGYYYQQYVKPAFIEQTILNKSLRDEDSANMVNILYTTQTYDIATIFNWGGITSTINGLPNNNNTNFASAYAAIETKIQTAMEKTMGEFAAAE